MPTTHCERCHTKVKWPVRYRGGDYCDDCYIAVLQAQHGEQPIEALRRDDNSRLIERGEINR